MGDLWLNLELISWVVVYFELQRWSTSSIALNCKNYQNGNFWPKIVVFGHFEGVSQVNSTTVQNHIKLIHWDYINHISAKYSLYLSIYQLYIIIIKAIFQSFEFGKTLEIRTPSPTLSSQNSLCFEVWTFWYSVPIPPPFTHFHFLGGFLFCLASHCLRFALSWSHAYQN